MKNKIYNALRIVISLALIGGLVWLMRNDLENMLSILRSTKPVWFVAAFLLNLIITILLSMRIQLVFEAAGMSLSLKQAIYLTFVGFFFNNFLPTSVGGDVIKAYYGAQISKRSLHSISAVLADRIFGTFGVLILALVGIVFAPKGLIGETISDFVLVATGLFLFGIVFLSPFLEFGKKVTKKLNNAWVTSQLDLLVEISKSYSIGKKSFTFALINSIGTKLLSVIAVYWLVISLNLDVPFVALVWVVPIAFAASLMPSINGLGFREGTFVFFLGPQIGTDAAFALALLWLGVYLLRDIIGGLMYGISNLTTNTGKNT